MSNFIIDAPLLACPDPAHWSQDDFQQIFKDYLSRLSELAMLKSTCKSIRFWRDEELSEVLSEQNCYPFRHTLTQAFGQLYDPSEFQLEDINNLATALLDRSMRIEDSGSVKDLVVSNCSLTGDPAINRSATFLNHLCRLVALALPILGDGTEFKANTYVASCGIDTSLKTITTNYTVDMAEQGDGVYLSNFKPTTVQIENYRGAVSLFRDADLTAWWANSSLQSVTDVCAIHTCIGHADHWNRIETTIDSLVLGGAFISSAQALGFMHEPTKINRLLRVCGDLVLGRNLANSHSLRAGSGPTDAQRVRGEWRAWRHDIDHEFHLHYWRLGNRIEVANVVVHNDFDITR